MTKRVLDGSSIPFMSSALQNMNLTNLFRNDPSNLNVYRMPFQLSMGFCIGVLIFFMFHFPLLYLILLVKYMTPFVYALVVWSKRWRECCFSGIVLASKERALFRVSI